MNRRWLTLAFAATFAASALSLHLGDFVDSDLPEKVHVDHLIANGLESLGWLAVFLLYQGKLARLAGRIGLFLIGMWLWDMTTTLPLALPVPPYQTVWGPASLLIQLYVIAPLLRRDPPAKL